MGPIIRIYDENHTNIVSSWNAGTVKAQEPSEVLIVNIWNNKSGDAAVSDLKDCTLGVYDADGGATGDVSTGKWVQVNIPSVDGDGNTWTAIGANTTKKIRANGIMNEYTIGGGSNNGTATATSNFCTMKLRINAPINSVPGNKQFRVRLTGYYT